MEHERDEVYERIPWETLEKKSNDRQWLIYVGAGAVTLGALAYSFVRNQPVSPPGEPVAAEAPITTATPSVAEPPPEAAVEDPVIHAEADLFAADPELLMAEAATFAEWFAVEYFSYDGSESPILAGMLGPGIPMPTAAEGIQVYVDWIGVRTVTQTGPLSFEVDVLVRSLLSSDESGFVRQPIRQATVPVIMDLEGAFRLAGLPLVSEALPQTAGMFDPSMSIGSEVGPDGVSRPVAVYP